MDILLSILLLSFLILVHELGHFLVAKRAGLLIEEFGLGLPPRIWGKKIGETVYSINWLPLGGFVRIHGETGYDVEGNAAVERALFRQPAMVRLAVLGSGVAMNFFLGVLLLSVLFSFGMPAVASERIGRDLRDVRVEVVDVVRSSPASDAGLRIGDAVMRLESEGEAKIALTTRDVREFVLKHAGDPVSIVVRRAGTELTLLAVPRKDPPPGEGPLGISIVEVGTLKYPWYRSVWEAVKAAFQIAGNTFAGLFFVLKNLVTTGKIGPGIAGPVGIVQIAGEAIRMGIVRILNFMAILTINLAALNILPIPALDGGRIFFLAIEKIRGKPVSYRFEHYAHTIGMILLIILIVLITIYDIRRL